MDLEEMFAVGKKITLQVEIADTKQAIDLIDYCLGDKKNESIMGVKINAIDFKTSDKAEQGEKLLRDISALVDHYRKNHLGNKIGERLTKPEADDLANSLNFPVKVLMPCQDDPTKLKERWQ